MFCVKKKNSNVSWGNANKLIQQQDFGTFTSSNIRIETSLSGKLSLGWCCPKLTSCCFFPHCRASLYALAGLCRSQRRTRGSGWTQRLPGGSVCPGWGGDGSLETPGPAHPPQAGPEWHKRGLHWNPQGELLQHVYSHFVWDIMIILTGGYYWKVDLQIGKNWIYQFITQLSKNISLYMHVGLALDMATWSSFFSPFQSILILWATTATLKVTCFFLPQLLLSAVVAADLVLWS